MPTSPEERVTFLGKMYDQLLNDINTHILVVWQSVATLVAAFAVLALVEKAVLPLDVAATIIILVALWLLCHVEDAAYWYNRNLVMIANIERQFLLQTDLHDIHYYFGKHRKKGAMITHLIIQRAFGVGLAAIVVVFHFWVRVWPGIGAPWSNFEPTRAMPYVLVFVAGGFLVWLHRRCCAKYEEFVKNSPGVAIVTDGCTYGCGHPPYVDSSAEVQPGKNAGGQKARAQQGAAAGAAEQRS